MDFIPRVPTFKIWTDGACKGNPGSGGWGAVIEDYEGNVVEIKGGESNVTNNQMELLAVIQALVHIDPEFEGKKSRVIVYTDSQYVHNGVTKWLKGWKRRGWKASGGGPLKNVEYWKALDDLMQYHEVKTQWVRGHNGDPGNERADELANQGVLLGG